MTKISYYRNTKDVTGVSVPLTKALEAINGCVYAPQIQAIRNAEPKDQDELKKNLPSATFGGEFKRRSITGLIAATGLLTLDFDVEGFVLPETLMPYAYAYWRSPRGGLKALIKIPVVQTDAEFKELFAALQSAYPDIDPSGKDISRLCFMSSDADLFLNEQAETWTKRMKIPAARPTERYKAITEPGVNWAKVALILKMIKTMQVGNRHENCIKAGNLAGGYLATGELTEGEIDIFKREIEQSTDDPKDHVTAFLDGVKYGRELPLSSKRGEPNVFKLREEIKGEYKYSEKLGNIHYTAKDDEIINRMRSRLVNDNERGYTTGWDQLDQLYSIIPGYMTLFYGTPSQGKSLFVMGLLINLSKIHGMNHVLFTPEMGSPDEVISTLIKIYTGKDFTNAHGRQMSQVEFEGAVEFVNKHFIVLDNEETGMELDIESLFLYVDLMEHKLNRKFNNIVVDPLIELRLTDGDMRDDLYWNMELKKARVLAKSSHRHLFLIHHSANPGRPDGIDGYGNSVWRQPSPFNIAFGQTFYRKAFFMLSVWFHKVPQAQLGDIIELKSIKKTIRVGYSYIRVVKAKPEGAGREGEAELRYCAPEHRFIDDSQRTEPVMNVITRDTTQSQLAAQQELEYDSEEPEWLK
jgi:hypothetical protein